MQALKENPEYINYIHVAAVAPLLGLTGWTAKKVVEPKADETEEKRAANLKLLGKLGNALMIIAVIVLLFHAWTAKKKLDAKKPEEAAADDDDDEEEASEGYQRRSKKHNK